MRRVPNMAGAAAPGDFWWTYDDWTDDGPIPPGVVDRSKPLRIWYLNPHGRLGSITVKPADPNGWDWDGDLGIPTISPSIAEHAPGDEARDWHGFIKAGEMTSA